MGISLYDFTNLHNFAFQEQVKERFAKIIQEGSFIEGHYNQQFERRFAQLQGAAHCALVANGTDAIQIALRVLGVGPGDQVGVPGISFFATAEAVLSVGATPVFIDVDPASGLMDYQSLEVVIGQYDLRAIIPVHIYGQHAPIGSLQTLCASRDIAIVEDAAQAMGSYYEDGRPVGSSGNLVTFSFYPTKNLSAFGDAGAIVVQETAQWERICQYRNHGRSPSGHTLSGFNSRCDHLQAAVLDLKLDTVGALNEKRKTLARLYHQLLANVPVRLVPVQYLPLSSWHLYPIGLADAREKLALQEHLKNHGIASALFYAKSLPEELPLRAYPGMKEQSQLFAANTLCLPIHPFLASEQVVEICGQLKAFLTAFR